MRNQRVLCAIAALLAIAVLGLPPAQAVLIQKMNLESLCGAAGSILRVQVESVEKAGVSMPGGEVPVLVYTLRLREALKGVSPQARRSGTVTLTMLDPAGLPERKSAGGDVQHVFTLPELPVLEPGGEYLLLTTEPGVTGLSTTVGLAQGLFHILPAEGGGELVRNGLDNIGLLDGMPAQKSLSTGSLTYPQIAGLIRNIVGESR